MAVRFVGRLLQNCYPPDPPSTFRSGETFSPKARLIRSRDPAAAGWP